MSSSRAARFSHRTSYGLIPRFRILDNFNLPLGAAEGDTLGEGDENMRSATPWTTAIDSENLKLYYHTTHNRRVRMVDLNAIGFNSLDELARLPLDRAAEQDIEEISLD